VKLRDLAARLDCRLEGDGDVEVRRVAGILDAEPGDVTFLANPKYEKSLRATRASAVILKDDAPAAPCAMLRAKDPYLAFARAVGLFSPAWRPPPGVHNLAAIAGDAQVGKDVSVGAFVAIGEGATVGDRTVIFPNVTIGPGARVGTDCVIHSTSLFGNASRLAIG
jgi:UDP-3-O-[3-hydroxymyristoyl] glucosamine N-acyltransferase